jgi:hypothetical protein
MKHISQQYKGDITLFVTIIVSAIMLILLTSLSQKISVESRISRESLYSQQALQAANTGIDAWQYQVAQTDNIDITSLTAGADKNWPNINAIGVESLDSSDTWIVLSTEGLSSIQYRVEFKAGNATTIPLTPPSIISQGRVVRGNIIIERTLQQEFKTAPTPTPATITPTPTPATITPTPTPATIIPTPATPATITPTTPPNLSSNFSHTTPWGNTWACSGSNCYRNGSGALTITQDGTSSITLQAYASVAEGTIIKTILRNGNECGRTSLGTLNATYNGVLYVNSTNRTPYKTPGTPNISSEQVVSDATVYQMAEAAGCTIY